jgi:lipoprotein-releasing system ATP-binding protein
VTRDLGKRYEGPDGSLEVLRGIDLEIAPGASLAVTGPSGSGKSTLLHLLGTLDRPTNGTVTIDGVDPFTLSDGDLARLRNRVVGFVFQDHHLLPQYSTLENVLLPALAFPPVRPEVERRASELLGRVGLSHRLDHRPGTLSGGERQRCAVARALIMEPTVVLCDEPTGNLDAAAGRAVAALLHELHREAANVLVIVTHSEALAATCSQRVRLLDGRCVEA